jgi:hypothetical protein
VDKEKVGVAKWIFWLFGIFALLSCIAFSINSCGLIAKTAVEREVFEHSYQKSAADSDAIKAYEAQITILRSKLNSPNTDQATKEEIEAQINAIKIMMATKQN